MKRSRLFWALVIVTALYFVVREGAQLAIHAGWLDIGGMMATSAEAGQEVNAWFGRDLGVVVGAANRLVERRDMYPIDKWMASFDEYNYSPFYALFISQISTRLPFNVHAFLHALVSLAAYAALFFTWRRLFPLLGMSQASEALVGVLPLWFLYAAWWGDAILLNIYILLALTVSWLFYLIWKGRLWPSALLLILILQVKPQWAFPLALPLVLGRFRFFAKLVALVVGGYLLVAIATVLWLGRDYGLAQYYAYYRMLAIAPNKIPWHGPGEYIGYDHSIAQIYFYLFGYTDAAWPIVRFIKVLILAPLAVVAIRLMRRNQADQPGPALEAYFALYFASFIWLDLVWETTLSIVVFVYLMMVLKERWARWLVAVPFVWYALVDLWQLIGIPLASLVVSEADMLKHGPPLWADPSFRLPLIMLVILTCYGLLVKRLWVASARPATIT
jgi:hypothetical protein